jgi:hypothetical protein
VQINTLFVAANLFIAAAAESVTTHTEVASRPAGQAVGRVIHDIFALPVAADFPSYTVISTIKEWRVTTSLAIASVATSAYAIIADLTV